MLTYDLFQKPRVRVLFLSHGLGVGGAERWLVTLAQHFNTVRCTGVVLFESSPGYIPPLLRELPRDVEVSSPSEKRSLRETVLRATRNADIIIGWGDCSSHLLRDLPVPLIQVSHTDAPNGPLPQDRIGANFLAAVSKQAANYFPEYLRRRTQVNVIHNGVPLERITPRRGRAAQREAWGVLSTEANVLPPLKIALYLGRFSSEKNPIDFCKAFDYLSDDWVGIMIGWGDLQETLMHSVAPNLPQGRNPFRVGFPKPDISCLGDIYDASDVVVIPSHNEAFPLVMAESFLAGKKLCITDLPIVPEIRERYGELFASVLPLKPTPQEIAVGIENAFQAPPDLYAAMQNCRYAFTASTMAHNWEEYIHECLGTWSQSGRFGQIQYTRKEIPPSPASENSPREFIEQDNFPTPKDLVGNESILGQTLENLNYESPETIKDF